MELSKKLEAKKKLYHVFYFKYEILNEANYRLSFILDRSYSFAIDKLLCN